MAGVRVPAHYQAPMPSSGVGPVGSGTTSVPSTAVLSDGSASMRVMVTPTRRF